MKRSHQPLAVGGLLTLALVLLLLIYDNFAGEGDDDRLHTQMDLGTRDSNFAQKQLFHQNHAANVTIQETENVTLEYKSSLLIEDDFVRDCITRNIIRRKEKIPTQDILIPTNLQSVENTKQRQKSFERVYTEKSWGPGRGPVDPRLKVVQGSGLGSSLDWAQEAMGILHSVITELKLVLKKDVIKIVDIPCGDFAWMFRFLNTRNDVNYTGMDIVPHLIANHKSLVSKWKIMNIHFKVHDLASAPLEEDFDLVLCRMMMQHLAELDILKSLQHISSSGSRFLLATTQPQKALLGKIYLKGGRFRLLNLEVPPVQMAPPLCMTHDGPPDQGWDHYLALWSLPLRQLTWCNKTSIPNLSGSHRPFITCT